MKKDENNDLKLCPKCNSKMMAGESSSGSKIWACMNFPKCKFNEIVRNILDEEILEMLKKQK